MNALVSILVPCHNAADWLPQTLESAIAQTWRHTEIIVVDDGSTDASLAIAQFFANQHAQIQVITQAKQGASSARNRAYEACQGEWIQYLDADDLLAPDKIERQMCRLEHCGNTFLAAGEWARFYDSPHNACFIPEPLWADLAPVDWLICAWQGNWMMHPAAWLVPRSLAEKAGPWDEALSLNDDGEYFCRVILASQGIQFCWGARSYYRSGLQGSLSRTRSDAAWSSALRSLESCYEHLLAVETSPRTREICALLFQRFVYEAYPHVPALRQRAELYLRDLGTISLAPLGGPWFQIAAAILGWQQAKRIQQWTHSLSFIE